MLLERLSERAREYAETGEICIFNVVAECQELLQTIKPLNDQACFSFAYSRSRRVSQLYPWILQCIVDTAMSSRIDVKMTRV